MDKVIAAFKKQFDELSPYLNERMKRLYAASIAKQLGHGGIKQAAKLTQLCEETVADGIKELGDP